VATDTNTIPDWKASGDWFDVCNCSIPCPCVFAQAPTYDDCLGVLAYHIKKGNYGQTPLDGLNVLLLSYFKGNIWAGETKADAALFFDERANEKQHEALRTIFSGKAGGFMAEFAKLVREVKPNTEKLFGVIASHRSSNGLINCSTLVICCGFSLAPSANITRLTDNADFIGRCSYSISKFSLLNSSVYSDSTLSRT
jgi:hypothetical protein